jgi:aminopeptidase N
MRGQSHCRLKPEATGHKRAEATRRIGGVLLLSALLAVGSAGSGQSRATAPGPTTPEPGVSQRLATERAGRISDLRYNLSFSIPADRQAPVAGRAIITFTLRDDSVRLKADPTGPVSADPIRLKADTTESGATTDPVSAPVILDFDPNRSKALHAVEANGRPLDLQPINGHIVVPASALQSGRNTVRLEFDAGDVPLNRSDEFLYTIFVPARAREAFPCFDQPDLKARWTLSLEVPDGWTALANGAETSREAAAGRTRVAFAETEPISTYLFAFAAGRFSIEQTERNGRSFRMFHRETDAQKVARNRDAIFTLHAAALDWLEQYTARPYPFGKFDFLLVPAFQFGGMEHPGAIFYRDTGLLLEESATQDQLLGRASVIAHETAHMWFGDLVTMRWFTDVWMKEVFANFMAGKIVNPSFPAVNHEVRFLLAHYPGAYAVDRTAGTNAIRQPLDNLNEAGTLYGDIIYLKAPIVMRQLEMLLGADTFRDGLREYLRRHAFANASWPDLIDLLDARTPEDLKAWSHAWVEERARPIVTTQLTIENGRVDRLALKQEDPYPRRGLTWNQQISVAFGYGARSELRPLQLKNAVSDIAEARGLPAPDYVLPNGAGLAYGEFHLDLRSRRALIETLPAISDELTRASAWVTLWDAMLNDEVQPQALIDLALRALPLERDELVTERVLGYLNQAFWRFTSPVRRSALAPRVEQALRDRLNAATTVSQKAAYFSTLRDVALTPDTVSWLVNVWKEEERVPGLPLAETDFIALAQELAVRAVPNWQAMLDQQIARTKNPDRKARLQFVAPALSANPSVRDKFFRSLGDAANRRREPWVLDGLRALHHPLRANEAIAYIRPSLELLHEIQRTGDIFFPKRWMDQTLGGHQSPLAATVVQGFLDQLPAGYPDRLRRIILSAGDDLFRAAKR